MHGHYLFQVLKFSKEVSNCKLLFFFEIKIVKLVLIVVLVVDVGAWGGGGGCTCDI